MKKSILFVAAMVLSTTFAAAQEYVYFGIKGGVNFSTISGDGFSDFNDESARTAYHLGLLAEVPVSDRFSIQPEVLYSAQGFDIIRREDNADIEHQLDFITVPVLAKLYVTNGWSFEAGPQVGFVVNEQIGDGDNDIDFYDEDRKELDMSLGLGTSFKFNNFFLYGRYNAGLTNIYDNTAADAKNSVIQAGIGLLF
ncbi:Outer membrane protein beta-barrel domain-containing protein [Salinimicrobium catena]|uniref:Outer membrane protein beta-barrel domain-containing protein n=1 Tax=Salinimicrobium catena TaxID=390640 RepID=A0A1H5PAL3_9FLAO|nr:porin family protein [Salinimicrobium catena]SDL74920.1 Outer membrane protein beta-barrel domain-containing protein [Salinimicrobium catena]SEF10108.1 Outer membrane protein beta-barrel domain-containing protein [Salinimicrobium catena]